MNLRRDGDAWLLDVLVSPRASKDRIGPLHGDRLKVAVTAPPVDGEANAAIVALFAKALSCPKRSVSVVAGHSSRRKTVRVEEIARERIEGLAG